MEGVAVDYAGFASDFGVGKGWADCMARVFKILYYPKNIGTEVTFERMTVLFTSLVSTISLRIVRVLMASVILVMVNACVATIEKQPLKNTANTIPVFSPAVSGGVKTAVIKLENVLSGIK